MKLKFVPQDAWIGLYWKRGAWVQFGAGRHRKTTWYLCLLPCCPIIWETLAQQH